MAYLKFHKSKENKEDIFGIPYSLIDRIHRMMQDFYEKKLNVKIDVHDIHLYSLGKIYIINLIITSVLTIILDHS